MFGRIRWRWVYQRYLTKWGEYKPSENYDNVEYFNAIVALYPIIPERVKTKLTRGSQVIPIYHEHFEAFMKACVIARNIMAENKTYNVPLLERNRVRLSQWLLTEDGYSVEYWGALKSVEDMLRSLYQEVTQIPSEGKRSYYFRQLNELFIDGLTLLLTPITEY